MEDLETVDEATLESKSIADIRVRPPKASAYDRLRELERTTMFNNR